MKRLSAWKALRKQAATIRGKLIFSQCMVLLFLSFMQLPDRADRSNRSI